MLRVDLFGSLRVTDHRRELVVPGTLPRALLARLALTPGEAVGAERLVEDVWASPPDSAIGAIRVYITRLRQRGLEGVLRGGRGGYALDVAPDAVDVLRFRALLAEAEPAEDDRRFALLREADALWTGEPFAGLDGVPALDRERAGLVAARQLLVESLAELRLRRDEPSAAAAALAPHVAGRPHDERLASLLATALARSGRDAEALAVIDDLRIRRRDDLGLDLSDDVGDLMQRIVRQEAATTVTGLRPARVGRTVRRRGIPIPLTVFVGRRQELDALAQARSMARLVTVTGPGGAGKTRLVVEHLRQATAELSDEQVFIDLQVVFDAERALVLKAIADGVDAEQPTLEAISRRLAAAPVTLVLDNAEHLHDVVRDIVRDLLVTTVGLSLIVTSRETLRVPGERVIPVGPMDTGSDAVRLFADRAADADPGFVLDERTRGSVETLCARLDGLPLALEIAAARLDTVGLGDVLDVVSADASDLGEESGRHGSLRAAIEWSIDLLDPAEREALIEVAGFGGSFTLAAVRGIAASGAETAATVARLARKSLIYASEGPDGERRFRLLEPIMDYAYPLADARERSPFYTRHARWYAGWVTELRGRLLSADPRVAHALLELSAVDLRLGLSAALRRGDRDSALRIVEGQSWHWFQRGRAIQGAGLIADALAVPGETDAVTESRTRIAQARLVFQYGDVELARTRLSEARAVASDAGAHSELALAAALAAVVAVSTGDGEAAHEPMAAALESVVQADVWERIQVAMCHGQVLRATGQPAQAMQVLNDAIAAARSADLPIDALSQVLAGVLIDARRGREALRVSVAAAETALRMDEPTSALALLHTAAGAAALLDRNAEAARLLGAVRGLGERHGYDPVTAEPFDAEVIRTRIRQAMQPEEWSAALAAGRALGLEQAVALARGL
ncbi:AAA family ATPase [Microbacterium sp. Au-Mic1]|uniref:AfsR/SARP family transcriptional regulator n=1 Tax=Microbacterium sp. Au-Mic1 TaxID=2906457 RepID=UPI001E5A5B29|nr:BTAD domain-containing putative transcriptional regulator [Microbacterium sp. Au-Mic1]MCE4025441.1 AAA family ATPase [Microbacterium sp. Au-Mic1]